MFTSMLASDILRTSSTANVIVIYYGINNGETIEVTVIGLHMIENT